jgi:hypothetical protein
VLKLRIENLAIEGIYAACLIDIDVEKAAIVPEIKTPPMGALILALR